MKRTSLSAGLIVYDMLTGSEEVMSRTNKVYPVVVDEAKLPYIAYNRSKLEHSPSSGGGADTVQIEVRCYTAQYAEGVDLAEAVRAALDYQKGEKDGLRMRSCTLADSSEGWEDDAYVQELTFSIKL